MGEWGEANPCSIGKGCVEYLGQFNKTNYEYILQVQSVFRHVQTGFNAKPWPHNVANMYFRHPPMVVWETFFNLASDKWCLSYGTTVKYTCKRLLNSHLVWLLNYSLGFSSKPPRIEFLEYIADIFPNVLEK